MRFCTLVLLLFTASSLNAQDIEGAWQTIFEGPFSYAVKTPPGWSSDAKAAHDMGIDLALHPDSVAWAKSPVVMYTKVTLKKDSAQALESVVEMDLQSFLKNAPLALASKQGEWLSFPQERPVVVHRIADQTNSTYERIAYVDGGHYVVMLVLGSKDASLVAEQTNALVRMAQSVYIIR